MLRVVNIQISDDANGYFDDNYHYIATFEIQGGGIIDHYKIEYSNDNGVTYTDITDNSIVEDLSIKYYSQQRESHMLRITPFVVPFSLISDLPSYDEMPSYTESVQNRFDIYDGAYRMVVYKPQQNKWTGSYQWQPDCMESLGSKLFGWKSGNLYLFNENFSSYNMIFGEQFPQRICFPVNIQGGVSVAKQVLDIALEGNGIVPNYAVLYSNFPKEQITDLVDTDWQQKEDVLYTFFLRDRLSEMADTPDGNLRVGDIISSQTPMIMIEFSEYNESLNSLFLNVGLLVSKGHLQILK